jgi:hypothetical protein
MRGALTFAAFAGLMVVASAPGCAHFNGPWPCNPGYASCQSQDTSNPGAENPGCETNVTSDPQNCGACGKTCGTGAVCTSGACGAAPTILTTDANPAELGIDSNDVFYWSSQQSQVMGLPKAGGTPYGIALQQVWPNDHVDNQNIQGFVVNDSGVYYLGQATGQMASQNQVWVDGVSPAGTSSSPKQIALLPSGGGNAAIQNLGALLLHGNTIYVAGQTSAGSTQVGIWAVATSGGSATSIATFTSNGSTPNPSLFAVDDTNLYLVRDMASGNEPNACEIDRIPATGGSPTPLVMFGTSGACPQVIASDGTNIYWGFTTQNNDACPSTVFAEPIAGGSQSTVAQFSGASETIASMTPDPAGGSLYVLTTESIWRVPTSGGGAPVRVAGNLQPNAASSMCCGCTNGGGGGNGPQASMAVDSTSVYAALPSGLIAVPK